MKVIALGLASYFGAHAVTPITKVTQLLTDMHAKGVAEKEEEANKFSAFSQWCTDQKRIKTSEIEAATERISMLDAGIQKAASDIKGLSGRIAELDEDVGRWKSDHKSAGDVRTKEHADFQATSADYGESLDALDGAISTLKKQAYDRAQADFVQVHKSLLQVQRLDMVPLANKKALAAFLQQAQPSVEEMPDEMLNIKNKEAHGYEFQSGGVVDMLSKLKDQFSGQKYELEKEEMNSKHAHEKMSQQLTDNQENANHEISKKSALRSQVQQSKAELEGDKAQTSADMEEDKTYLSDTKGLCAAKTADFESRQKLRGEELASIQEAVDILSSDKVAGAGEKHLPVLLQRRHRGKALVQLRASLRNQNPLQTRIAAFLSDRASTINSKLLSLVSQRVAADPFTKVKKLIKDLIVKLMEEATQETEHKGWCDAELATNKVTRDSKAEGVTQLTAQAEELSTAIVELTQDMQDLSAAVKELDAAMAQATLERSESKATNDATIAEAKEAQAAITQATALLKDYYAKSAEATSFLQQEPEEGTPAADAPETFSSPYKGMLPAGGNVVDFLEVILSDFARLESDTSAAEAMEVDQFKQYMFESKKDKALKENEIEHKTGTKSDKESALHQTQSELKATQEQLDKAVTYYEKLKPTCVDSGITYEERVQRREEEIQSLQEALKILAGTDVDLS